MLRSQRIGVVVPAFNEEDFISRVICSVPTFVDRVYVVDDGSTDRTWSEIVNSSSPRLVPIRNTGNLGVGAAISAGYKRALEDDMDIVAVMGGDGQMDPLILGTIMMPVLMGEADYSKGNRLTSGETKDGMPRWRLLGNTILTFLTQVASGCYHIQDPQNGYTAVSRKGLEILNESSIYPYYGYPNHIICELAHKGARIVDIPMKAKYGNEKSKIGYPEYVAKVGFLLLRKFIKRLKASLRDSFRGVVFASHGEAGD
ncbi:MAG: glycosyltransferase family 2 protein [Thermoplasmata archaeon]|nr:glycosyltransferase family 2 protein [Thermoplasmata archaeon]